MNSKRLVEINSPNYTFTGKLTIDELFAVGDRENIISDDVTIGGLVIYGWDEVDMIWEATTSDSSAELTFGG